MTYPKVFVAACWDANAEAWPVQKVFLDKNEAVDFAYAKTQNSVRCNRPLEYWRVEEHQLTPCSSSAIVWGCPCNIAGGCC